MRRLFKHELYKLTGQWRAWAALFLLIVVNLLLTIGAVNTRLEYTLFAPREYRSLHKKLALMTEKDAFMWLEEEMKAHENELWEDIILYSTVQNELRECLTYGKHLQQIGETAQQLKQLSLFSDIDTFSFKNANKTVSDFKKVEGVSPSFAPSMGIVLASKGVYTDILAVMAVFSMSFLLFTYEKERNLSLLTHTTPNGGVYHCISKIFAIWIGCIMVVMVLYIPKLLLNSFLFGLGNLARPIQSVTGYSSGTIPLTVWEFFLCFWGLKLITLMILGLLFSVIATVTGKASHGFICTAVSLAGMSYLYRIPYWHPLSMFAVTQPLTWIRAEDLLCKYLNYNLLGLPVERFTISTVAILIAFFGLVSLLIFFYPRQQSIAQRKRTYIKKRQNTLLPVIKKHRLLAGEFYKLLIQNRTIWILLGFMFAVIYIFFSMPMRETFDSIDEMQYKRITMLYEGELSTEKEVAIFDEVQKTNLSTNILEDKLHRQIDYLHTKEKSSFLYDVGYKKLTFGELQTELWLILIGSVMLIAVLGGLYAVEYQTGVIVLIRSSCKGILKVFHAKSIVSYYVTVLVGAFLYIPYLFSVLNVYGKHALSAPAYSLAHLWFAPQFFTISAAVFLSMLLRFLILCLITKLILWSSGHVKSINQNYILCSGIILVPILLCLLWTI